MGAHIQALAQSLKPAEFALRALPSTARPEDLAAAMRDAGYLVAFLRFLPDEAQIDARALGRMKPKSILISRTMPGGGARPHSGLMRRPCREAPGAAGVRLWHVTSW